MTTETTITETVHRVVAAWKGDEPGSAGIECLCGDTFDGFNTIAEAEACHKPLRAEAPKPTPSWLEPRSHYHTNAATIAAQLHEIADAIAALGDMPLSEVSLDVSIQACQHRPHRDRVATVDALAGALGMSARAVITSTGPVHYGFSYEQANPVNVFACVVSAAEFEEGQLLAEVACGRCRQPFDPDDKRPDGAAQYGETRWCKGCIDSCHEATDFGHSCAICTESVTS